MKTQTIPRKIQYKTLNDIWCYWTKDINCSCDSNVYHHEYDGNNIFCVCNACNADIATIKEKFIDEELNKGIWK